MKARTMILIFVIIASLLVQLPPIWADNSNFKLGFSPFHLFDSSLGSPVYMQGEELWVFHPETFVLSLLDPRGKEISSKVVAGAPVHLYTFQENDLHGEWILVDSEGIRHDEVSLLLVGDTANVIQSDTNFKFDSGELIVEGSLELEPDAIIGPGELVLTKRTRPELPLEFLTDFVLDSQPLNLQISQEFGEQRSIRISPHFVPLEEDKSTENLSMDEEIAGEEVIFDERDEVTPVGVLAWAEATYFLPLVKISEQKKIVTLRHEAFAKIGPERMVIQANGNDTLTLKLPSVHKVGQEGSVPMRYGQGNLTIFIQLGNTIHVTSLKVVFLPGGWGLTSVGSIPLMPLNNVASYSFRVPLGDGMDFDLIQIARVEGADRVWSQELSPPIARISVFNLGSIHSIKDYSISFEKSVEDITTVNGETFVLLGRGGLLTDYRLVVNGIPLREGETNPQILELNPFGQRIIVVTIPKITFRVVDHLGSTVPRGNMTLMRSNDTVDEFATNISWSSKASPHLFLPSGLYRAIVQTEGAHTTATFEVGERDVDVEIMIEELGPVLDINLVIIAIVVITFEGILALLLWRRALRISQF